jgi:N6-adenosine-specific RNA methylase IME4
MLGSMASKETSMKLEFHPLASIFPLMEGEAFDALVASVKASNGPRNPIMLFEDKILDGRNRYRACLTAGIEIASEMLDDLTYGDDPLQFVLDQNLDRRHLNAAQLAMAADELANLPPWRPAGSALSESTFSQPEAAAKLRTGRTSVQAARKVKTSGTEKWQQAVWQGRCPVQRAAEIAEHVSRETQDEWAAAPESVIIELHEKWKREQRRDETFVRIRAETPPLPTQVFTVIYADPPWRFTPYSFDTSNTIAEHHYPTMEFNDIFDLDVASIARPDSVLFLWATVPMMPEALEVMKAWGFEYKSHCAWHKTNADGSPHLGNGYWFRNAHELLLLGTRGGIPAPIPGKQWPSLIAAPVGEHSEKPEIFIEMIEEYFPDGLARVELFHRGEPRPGWNQWGYDVEADRETKAG